MWISGLIDKLSSKSLSPSPHAHSYFIKNAVLKPKQPLYRLDINSLIINVCPYNTSENAYHRPLMSTEHVHVIVIRKQIMSSVVGCLIPEITINYFYF